MQNLQDSKERIYAAHKLLLEKSTSREKFESLRRLIEGMNPRIDKILASLSEILKDLERLQKGEVIQVSAEHLPENSEEEKKRKRAILLFIRYWQELKSEVERISKELDTTRETKSQADQIQILGKILAYAKGPFGILTLVAIIIISVKFLLPKSQIPPPTKNQTIIMTPYSPTSTGIEKPVIKGIVFEGKKIPLSQLSTGQGMECMSGNTQAPHYHALDHNTARSLDGAEVKDPGGCGFGKVAQVKVVDLESGM